MLAPIAILLSGSGRTLDNLLAAIERGELPASVAVVVASRECLGAEKARKAGIPTVVMPGVIPAAELGAVLQKHGVEPRTGWVVLAGYLKLVQIPPGFDGRIVNIHPALLPDFGGPGMHGHKVHEAVLKSGAPRSGCTVHLCDSRYDTGPIVLQKHCQVLPNDTPDTLAARVFEAECAAYPEALRTLIGGRPAASASESGSTWGGRVIAIGVLIVCAIILTWSGLGKLRSPDDAILFVQAIVPSADDGAAATVVTAMSVLELFLMAWLVAGLLTSHARPRAALAAFAALMLMMAGFLALALSRGFEGSCGCFGSGGADASLAVLRTACLAVVAVMGIVYSPRAGRAIQRT